MNDRSVDRSNIRFSVAFGFGAMLVAGVLSAGLDVLPPTVALCGLFIVGLSAVPILYHDWRGDEPIPFFPMIGAYYLVFYGLPIFATPLAFLSEDRRVVLYERVVLGPLRWDVTLLCGAGIVLLFAGFQFSRAVFAGALPHMRFSMPEPRSHALNICYWILIAASILYRLFPSLAAIPSIGQFLEPASFLALGGFLLQWRAGSLPRWQALAVLLIFVPVELYLRARHLFITDFIFLCVFFILILWRCGQYRVIVATFVVGLVAVAFYSATTAYRSKADTLIGKIAISYTGFQKAWHDGRIARETLHAGTVYFIPALSPLVNRLGHIWIFQTVYEHSPVPIPYWGGETYRPLLTAAVPRAIYANKPKEQAGEAFGLRYGFAETSDGTSFNIPWIVELLANFGPYGVLAGMTLFGLLLGFLNHVFNSHQTSNLEFLIGLTVIFRLFYQESNFSVMVGSLPVLVLSLYLYFRFGPPLIDRFITTSSPHTTP